MGGGRDEGAVRYLDHVCEEIAAQFTKQILEGLQHLHERDMCHLDLKVRLGGDFLRFIIEWGDEGVVRYLDHVSEEIAAQFTKQILEGLQHLHERDICHLDLKVRKHGGGGRDLLLNWGGGRGLLDHVPCKWRDRCTVY